MINQNEMNYDLKLYLNNLNIGLANHHHAIGDDKTARKILINVNIP